MSTEEKIQALIEKSAEAELGGGEERIEIQHNKGKWTAQERINYLLDKETFEEFGKFVLHQSTDFGMDKKRFPGDGVVTGYGKINERPVCIFAQDFTVTGGSLGHAVSEKNMQDYEYGPKNRHTAYRIKRFRGSQDTGRGIKPFRIWGDLHAERPLVRYYSTDFGNYGTMRRRRCIFPCAGIAVMGPEGAVNIIFKKDIKESDDPKTKEQELVEEYRNTFASPYRAAERGYIDEIITPEQTRPKLIRALELLRTKKKEMPSKKHDNLPL